MAALFALQCSPDDWQGCRNDIIHLFTDSDLNIRYAALKLAATMKDSFFIDSIISELYEDAVQQRVSTFGARCGALHRITGHSFEPVPEWRDGQCWYSERSTAARIYIAQQWMDWQDKQT